MNSSRTNAVRVAAGAALAGLCAVAVAGCGNDVPSNAVAKVDDTVITKDQFDRWFASAVKGQQQSGGSGVVPDPPNYTKCVAALKAQPQPKGAAKPKDSDLKKQCKQTYDQLRQQVMQFLIQSEWVQQEAADQDIEVSNAEVRKSFEQQKKQAFPKEKDYRKFLRTSGMTEEDVLFRVKLDSLQKKITEKVTKEQDEVTSEDVEEYYDKNKKRFAQPERRDLNIVLTKTEAQAKAAKSRLDGGESFKAVSKDVSIDEASKAQGGKLPDVPQGQQEKSFDKAVFDAKTDEIEGPVKTQFGWYVFEVTKVKPARQQPLPEVKASIRQLVKSEGQQKALQDFIKDFREEFKDKTVCDEDFTIAECSNAPDEKTDTGPASGGAPGAPQGAPQGAPAPQGGAAPQGAPQPQQAPPPTP